MEYHNFLPSGYRKAIEKLREDVNGSFTVFGKKQRFASFSEKYTVLPYLWIERIGLEAQHGPLLNEVYFSCLTLENLAFKHFYHPRYVSNFPNNQKEKYWKLMSYQRLENFLTFPHSQLRAFYRHHQFNCPTPLPDEIQKKYNKAVESYDYMVSIAMEPEKWLEWMQQNFQKLHWIRNLEAKLGEHSFMRPIWNFYIDLLAEKNDIKVLNVYKRYCRLFIQDKAMQEKYSATTFKFLKLGYDVSKWLFDQAKLEYDFGSKELGKAQMKSMLLKLDICEECFGKSNKRLFNNELKRDKEVTNSWFSMFLECKEKKHRCCVCPNVISVNNESMFHYNDKADRDQYFYSLREAQYVINRSYKPIIKLQFHDSLRPPIPKSIFNYIIENANHHEVLAQLYKTCKYFFVKKLILICHQLYVSKSFEETFIKNSCATNFSTLLKHPFIEKFCCKILIFHDWKIRTYLSASFSKICFCSLTCLRIGGQNLTMEEFLLIINGGKLEQVKLKDIQIYKADGNLLVIEEIIKLLPSVVELSLKSSLPQMYTSETAQKLAELDRSTKFESLELDQIPEGFEFYSFGVFLKKNLIPKADITLRLRPNIDQNFVREFEQFCKTTKSEWNRIYEAPEIDFD
uniref:Uncharacterized protein n=1 Tax=Panagrolaimus sp. ES5 TaxID=591445 RepID=A0AC34GSV8_9BILA